MELLAVLHHAVLDRQRRLDSVTRVRGSWYVTNNAHTRVCIGPQPGTVRANVGVPVEKFGKGDIVLDSGATVISALSEGKYYIMKGAYFEEVCRDQNSMEWIDGYCYTLEHRGEGYDG